MIYLGLAIFGLAFVYVGLSYQLYRRAFLPPRPIWLDDFTFTPFEFQADYEEVDLTTADGLNFGAWHFGSPAAAVAAQAFAPPAAGIHRGIRLANGT